MRTLVAFFFLALTSCSVSVDKDLKVGNSSGGFVAPTIAHIEELKSKNLKVTIDGDVCWSSCTMYLSVARCVGKDTDFGFHGAANLFVSPNREATHLIAEFYPGRLKYWYLGTEASHFNPLKVTSLKGKEVSELTGIPTCEKLK